MKSKSQQGVTLVEIMVTISVLAIILAVAGPGFQQYIASSRSNALSNDLLTASQLARSEAIKRSENVRLCRRNAAGTACDNNTDWSAGWLVISASNEVIRVWAPVNGATITATPAGPIAYRPVGMADLRLELRMEIDTRPDRCFEFTIGGRARVMENCP